MDRKICRVCLEIETAIKFTPIFAANGKLALKIFELAEIVITEFEGELSATMCSNCIKDLDQALHIKKLLMDNNNAFLDFQSKERIKGKLQNELQVAKESIEKSPGISNQHQNSNNRALKRKPDKINSSPCKITKFSQAVELNFNGNDGPENSDEFHYIDIKQEVFEDDLDSTSQSYSNSPTYLDPQSPIDIITESIVDESQRIQCEICQREFSKSSYLKQHMTAIHADKEYKCTTCGKKFKTEKICQQHMSKHMIDKPYKCGLCTKTFCHKSDMKRHQIGHSKKNRFMCELCTHGFARKDHLLKHKKTHLRKLETMPPSYT